LLASRDVVACAERENAVEIYGTPKVTRIVSLGSLEERRVSSSVLIAFGKNEKIFLDRADGLF